MVAIGSSAFSSYRSVNVWLYRDTTIELVEWKRLRFVHSAVGAGPRDRLPGQALASMRQPNSSASSRSHSHMAKPKLRPT